jgi:microcystin-dependent protein
MAETNTPNFKWTKPDIGGDSGNWGNVLNTTIDEIDSVVWANQQAGLPIGSVAMFAGATAPVNWLICDGSSLATTGTYAGLFGIVGYTYGGAGANFNLPNLVQNFPLGAGANPIGTTGGTFNYTLSVANMPPHTHPIEQTPHSHSAYQNAHSHVIATGGHNHPLHDPVHTHTYATLGGGVNIQPGSGGNMSNTGTTGGAVSGVTIDPVGNLGGNTDTQTPGVGVNANYANINNNATDSVGSGAAISIVPPFIAINFIIRAV